MGQLRQLLSDHLGARAGDTEGGTATNGGSVNNALQGMLQVAPSPQA